MKRVDFSHHLDINCRSDEKNWEWAEFSDDVLVDGGDCGAESVEDEGHRGAGQDADQEY